jgi:phosphinothricin acetyltransferase
MAHTLTISQIEAHHWPDIKAIYEQGLLTGVATFETESPSWEQWDASHLSICRLVAQEGDQVVGWIALSPVSSRCVYGGVAEISVYIHRDHRGKGIGKQLLREVVSASEDQGYWMLQAGIMPANVGSVKLHESVGFRIVGYRERISQVDGIWMDNLLLERRSAIVGVD